MLLCWVFAALQAFPSCCGQGPLSSRGVQTCHWGGVSHGRAQAPGFPGSQAVVHVHSCSEACGIPDQGSDLYLLHQQADSLPLSHQGRQGDAFLVLIFGYYFRARWSTEQKHSIPMKTTSKICLNFLLSTSLYVSSSLWTAPQVQDMEVNIPPYLSNDEQIISKNAFPTKTSSGLTPCPKLVSLWMSPFLRRDKIHKGPSQQSLQCIIPPLTDCHRKVTWWLEEPPVCVPKYYKCANILFSQ